jgi:HAD domain in Swiss Army Knife RNA repair proteins
MPEAKMKVIFLDFDGVLNSEGSFRMEVRRKNSRVSNTLSAVACSNLQYILEQDSSVKIVISSTWRCIHTPVELTNILNGYGVEAARIIGYTPRTMSRNRGHEIRMWLDDHPNVKKYVILDDDYDAGAALYGEEKAVDPRGHFFQTTPEDGLLFKTARQIAKLFRGEEVKRKAEVE